MPVPPDPGIVALLLTAAAQLGYRVEARITLTGGQTVELLSLVKVVTGGEAQTRYLALVAGTSAGLIEWAITTSREPFVTALLTRFAYQVLTSGTFGDKPGGVIISGKEYRLRLYMQQGFIFADAVEAT